MNLWLLGMGKMGFTSKLERFCYTREESISHAYRYPVKVGLQYLFSSSNAAHVFYQKVIKSKKARTNGYKLL